MTKNGSERKRKWSEKELTDIKMEVSIMELFCFIIFGVSFGAGFQFFVNFISFSVQILNSNDDHK